MKFLILILLVTSGCAIFGGTPKPSFLDQLATEIENFNNAISSGDSDQKHTIAMRVSELATREFDAIKKALKGTERERVSASFGIGFVANKEALQIINAQLDSEKNPMIKRNLIAALGTSVYLKTIDVSEIDFEKIKQLLFDTDDHIRQSTLYACTYILKEGDDRGLIDRIHILLKDNSPLVRNNAVILLITINNAKSFDELVKTSLFDRDALVRRNTAIAIKTIGKDRSIEYLIELLRDRQHAVVEAAHNSLMELTGKELGSSYLIWKQFLDEGKLKPTIYFCPTHHDVTSKNPGKCKTCNADLQKKQ